MPELPTQARREEMIKSLKRRRKSVEGRTGLRHLRKTIDFTIERIRENRRRREIARLPDGVRRFSSISPGGRRPVLLDRRPMLERLHSRIEGQIPFYFRSAYRYDGAGSIKIAITKDPAKVGVSQSTFNDWEFYSKAARFPKQIVVTSITVPNAWRIRVLKKGLANVGGLVTLDAQQLEGAPAGIDLYAATWIEQGRGYQVHAVSGFIAVEDGQSYHAETADKA
ncbi:MAG: hypothetical protein EOM21_16020, partial [Gammaproteobacteria bacterium]|nr:hypothetical protein [Gammaproteobacteria bacterium]